MRCAIVLTKYNLGVVPQRWIPGKLRRSLEVEKVVPRKLSMVERENIHFISSRLVDILLFLVIGTHVGEYAGSAHGNPAAGKSRGHRRRERAKQPYMFRGQCDLACVREGSCSFMVPELFEAKAERVLSISRVPFSVPERYKSRIIRSQTLPDSARRSSRRVQRSKFRESVSEGMEIHCRSLEPLATAIQSNYQSHQ